MKSNITGYYQQIHFKCNDLILYYNYPVVTDELNEVGDCHHISKLKCSKANSQTPEECIKKRKCDIYIMRDELFTEVGIDGKALKKLDQKLRNK